MKNLNIKILSGYDHCETRGSLRKVNYYLGHSEMDHLEKMISLKYGSELSHFEFGLPVRYSPINIDDFEIDQFEKESLRIKQSLPMSVDLRSDLI